MKKQESYQGFEQGPIRPPSEAYSLLVRVSRNCPWNRCKFCHLYKGSRFSIRPVEHVKRDIDAVYRHVESVRALGDHTGTITRGDIQPLAASLEPTEWPAFQAAVNWVASGMESIFLQDANSLIVPPADLLEILRHLQTCFGRGIRITSYARSHTIARIKDQDLAAFAAAGLNRLHIGLESGSDEVLKMVSKGVTKATHIKAGRKVKRSGIELSEYIMPGLGGRALSAAHATETADALNQINADFIRIRTLALPTTVPLYADYAAGRFEKSGDVEMAAELLALLEMLEGIDSLSLIHI